MSKEEIKSINLSFSEPKKVSESKLMKLLRQIKQLEQWFGKMSGFFSISIKNLQNFSRDSLAFCQQFNCQQNNSDECSSINQFKILINSFGLQLSYFESSSKFIQTQFQHTYQQSINKFKSSFLNSEISQKMKNSNMQQSVIEVVQILQKYCFNFFSQNLSEYKQNIVTSHNKTQKTQQFLNFFQKLIKSIFNSSISSVNLQQHLTELLSSLNEQIISYSKKLHSIIMSLFKNLLLQISNRFLHFKTSYLSPILRTNLIYVFDCFESNLDQYHEIVKNKSKQQCLWIKGYLNNIRMKLQKRNDFCQKYYKLLIQYLFIFQNIACKKYKNGHNQALKLLGKHPLLINDKTRIIIESLETTLCSIITLIEKLTNQLLTNTKQMKQTKQKINIFIKKVLNKIEEIQNTKDSKCLKLIDLIKNVDTQQRYLLKSFQEIIQKYMQNIFISFSQIQSKLLVINQTYFGLNLRDISKHIKVWALNLSKNLIQIQQNNNSKQNILKANEKLLGIKSKLINPNKNKSTINNSALLLENPIYTFYCICNNTIGQLFIFTNKIKFCSIFFTSITFTINSQQINKIIFINNLLQIHGIKIQRLNFFNQTSYVSYLLRSLFSKPQNKVLLNKIVKCSEQNESQQQEQQRQEMQYLCKETQKQRQLKLCSILNNKFQSLSSIVIQNTNCIHLLNILFGQKSFSSGKKQFKQFYLYFKQKQGELNLKHDSWDQNPMNYITQKNIKSDSPMFFKRKFRFDHPIASMGIPFIPKTCNSIQIQQLVLASKDKFFIESQVQSTGAPYTDCFILRVRTIFSNIDNCKIKLDFVIEMQWLKKTMMKSMVQKQGYGETKVANQAFIKILKQAVNKFPIIKQTQIIKVTSKIKKQKPKLLTTTMSPNYEKQNLIKIQQINYSNLSNQLILFLDPINNLNKQTQSKQLQKYSLFQMSGRFFLLFLISILWNLIYC